ncbi:MAG TPA: sigma-70 family RNA polymerase sigma factor [Gemmataceae bacterium]|jgi:RNA polymerase sigma-70 factor (ECF subfamily)|nr:sigma-70 family RNA polymerase sigma factor [Gemmataceae bacterium]
MSDSAKSDPADNDAPGDDGAVSDAELEARIRAGQMDALVMYLEANKRTLLAHIERKIGADLRKRIDPDDIFQETVLAALRGLPAAAGNIQDVFGWLRHLAEQRAIDLARHHRAGKRDPRREVSGRQPAADPGAASVELVALLSASLTTASMAAVRGERQGRLQACLTGLSPESREALRLRYGEGLATKEIAARMNRSDVSVRVLLSRTLQALQKLLADETSI